MSISPIPFISLDAIEPKLPQNSFYYAKKCVQSMDNTPSTSYSTVYTFSQAEGVSQLTLPNADQDLTLSTVSSSSISSDYFGSPQSNRHKKDVQWDRAKLRFSPESTASCLEEITEDSERDSHVMEEPRDKKEDSNKIIIEESLSPRTEYMHVVPTFNTEGPHSSYLTFINKDREVINNNGKRFSTAFAKDPLPLEGTSKFSVYVERCSKVNPLLYVGVATGNVKSEGLVYKPGRWFISTFSSHAFLNGLKTIPESAYAKQGQTISVLVDREKEWISFEVDGVKIIEGKLKLPKGKTEDLYPCISMGELSGRVGFV